MAFTSDLDSRKNLRNYLINGDMRIAQRGTSFAAIANAAYSLDRWKYLKVGSMVHTISQDTDVPTLAQSGYLFQNSLRMNLTTPQASLAAGDYCLLVQYIEGYNWANLAQKPVTISFWVKASLPGTYVCALTNSGPDRSLVKEYTINSANTWEYKSFSMIASPAGGTWNYTNGNGVSVVFTLGAGSTFQTTAGAWQTGNLFGTSTAINGLQSGATDFRVTGVMINEGLDAPNFKTFGGNIQTELAACQRYYEKSYNYATVPGTASAGGGLLSVSSGTAVGTCVWHIPFAVVKRANPVVTPYNPLTGAPNSCDRNTVAVAVASASQTQAQASLSINATTADNSAHSVHFVAESEL